MEVKKAKKVIARPVQVNSSQTSSATTTTVRTAVARPTFIGIKDVQRLYLPMLSIKKIRKIVNNNVHTIKAGNKIMVNREQLEKLLHNPEIKTL